MWGRWVGMHTTLLLLLVVGLSPLGLACGVCR